MARSAGYRLEGQSIDIITGGSNTDSVVPASFRTAYFSHSLRPTGIDMFSKASALPFALGVWIVGDSLWGVWLKPPPSPTAQPCPGATGRRLPTIMTRGSPHNAATTPGDLMRHKKVRRRFSTYPRVLYFFYRLAKSVAVSFHPAADIALCIRLTLYPTCSLVSSTGSTLNF